MMVFEDFTKELVNRMETRLGKGYRIQVKDTLKNNSIVEHQLMLQKKGSSVAPAVYLQEQYELYMKQPDEERLNWIIENILASYEQQEKEMGEVSKLSHKLLHYEYVKDNILFKLINTEDNKELLMQVPHSLPGFINRVLCFHIGNGTGNYDCIGSESAHGSLECHSI